MSINKIEKKGGFTLVEMLVAIAIFSIVMTVAAGALLNVIDANRKAQAIKTVINNLEFALEGISKDMRMGTEYSCSTDGGNTFIGDCSGGGNAIRYKSPKAGNDWFAYYKFDINKGQLWECLQNATRTCNTSSDYQPLTTTEELTINKAVFYVLGVENPDDPATQPRMILTISGTAGTKTRLQTTFDLQTGVSQRIRPIITTTTPTP